MDAASFDDKTAGQRQTTFAMDMEPEEYSAMERRIVRKQDWRLLPWLISAYFLSYLDRVSLGNARTLNSDKPGESLVEVLRLSGDRYSVVVALFFIPYCILEFPTGYFLKWMKPSKFIGRICVTWGIVTVCTAAVKTYEGLIVARIFLGITEAGFFPACLIYLCYWYKPAERATRMAIFAASVSLAGAFGGVIATGVSFMSGLGGLHGWQWLFILEGIPSIILGLFIWFLMPDWPETAKFLTDEERLFVKERLGPYAPKGTDEDFNKKEFFAVLLSWQFWAFAIIYFMMTNSLNAVGYFLPSVLTGMGFTGYKSQLMTVPINAVGFFAIIANSWHSDRTKERPKHILGAMGVVALGYLLLAVLPIKQVGGRFVGLCLIACTNAAVIPFIAYRSVTVTGATATGIAVSSMVAFANTAGAVAPFLFRAKDAPRYLPGLYTLFAFFGASMVIMSFIWWRLGGSSEYKESEIDENHQEVEVPVVQEVAKEKK